jgi:hypothetical protein
MDSHRCTLRWIIFLICSDEAAAQKWLVDEGVAKGPDTDEPPGT